MRGAAIRAARTFATTTRARASGGSAMDGLIPPKIASAKAIGSTKDSARMEKVIDFYNKLPKGSPQQSGGSGPFAWYKRRYFDGENASGAPILHLLGAIFVAGYIIDYQMHLKHHKNNHA